MRFRSFSMLNAESARIAAGRLIVLIGVVALFSYARLAGAQAAQTFTSSGSSSSPAINVGATSLSAVSSAISVSNPNGSVVSSLSIKLNGVTTLGDIGEEGTSVCPSPCVAASMNNALFWLKAPSGTQFVLLGATGDTTDGNDNDESTGSGLSGAVITIEDSATIFAPWGGATPSAWTPQNGTFTVKPSSYWIQTVGSTPLSGPVYPSQDGSGTLNGTLGDGTTGAAGTWTLYVQNFGSPTPITVSNWSLTLNYETVTSVATTTSVSSSAQPATLGNTVTFTATVASTSTVNNGTVTFTATSTATGATSSTISGCGAVPVSNGTAQCTVSTNTLGQGTSSIQASYVAGTGFLNSSGGLTQLVLGTSTNTAGDTWCNTAAITIPADGVPQNYPAVITVSGYPAGTTVSTASVQLKSMGSSTDLLGQYLLVAPGGQNLDFLDNAFEVASASGVNVTIQDDAGQNPTGPPASGTYNPYDNENSSASDAFPTSPANSVDSSVPAVPSTISHPAPYGSTSQTFASNFNGAPANGNWALYATTNNGAAAQAVSGGWCVNLTLNTGVSSTTKLTSSLNPASTGQSVTYTATVTSGGSPVTSGGTVTFLDNDTTPGGTVSGNNVVNLSTSTGTATFASSSLYDALTLYSSTVNVYEGDHTLTAAYSGGSSDNPSQGTLIERLDNTTSFTAGGGSINACNAGPVYSAQGNKGPATPNPSNIFVTGVPGTVNTVTLTLENFSTSQGDVINDLESMVAGPNKLGLDFFSRTGGSTNNALTAGNYTFADSASSAVPNGSFGPGTYKPTSNGSTSTPDTFTSSISGFYNLPTSFNYAQPGGSATFTSTFGSINPNGTWSLFFDMNTAQDSAGAANGWCLNFTENPVSVAVDESHSGAGTGGAFAQGQTGAQLTTVITNEGTGSTGDPVGSNPLVLTDTLNSALTYTGFSGSGWSCSASGQTITCKNDSPIAQGSAYPTLTLIVNVSSALTGNFTNSVNVSGAGIASNSASDTITVDAAPVLFVTKTAVGSFTQGSTAQWSIAVSNIAANGATNGQVTVLDTLPSGYTLNSYTSTGSLWTCSGTNAVTCTAVPGLSAGTTSTITLTVNVPASSPTSVSNTASAYGGGDLVHTSPSTATTSNTSTVTVAQVPASLSISSGNSQSAVIDTAFSAPLVATVTDAGGVGIPGVTVTFTAPTALTSSGLTSTLKFSNATTSISAVTSAAGQASSGSMTANLVPGGPYNVQASAASLTGTFLLTNLHKSLTTIASLSSTSATVDVFGYGTAAPGGQLSLTDVTTSNPITAPVMLNTANAQTTLLPMVSDSTGANTLPVWTVIGDVNGDGIPDLVTSLYQTDSVSVQLGNGDGTFQAASTILIATGFGPAEAHLVSLRGNGTLDLIVGSFNLNEIAVLLGNGNGTFQTPVFYTSGTSSNWTSSLTTGDFNHDGNLDVAVANAGDNTVSILLGNGSGALTLSGSPISVGHEPEAIRAGDFTGSGYSDLVTANFTDGTISTLLNNESGGFTRSTVSVGSGAHSGPQALAITGTGSSLKLAVANYNDSTVSVMTSNGSGSFGSQTIVAVGKGPDDVTFTDFNGDGIPDLAVASYNANSVNILIGKTGGGYTVVGPFAVGQSPYSAAVGDLDLDGTPDIVTSNCFSNSAGSLLSGTQIAVSYTGLALTAGDSIQAAYTPNASASYGASTSTSSTALVAAKVKKNTKNPR
jgi:uncharacterized repeat protein (TIGR01451 family)